MLSQHSDVDSKARTSELRKKYSEDKVIKDQSLKLFKLIQLFYFIYYIFCQLWELLYIVRMNALCTFI